MLILTSNQRLTVTYVYSTATVYKAMVDDNLCAVKRYTLEELDEKRIQKICEEISISWQLSAVTPLVVKSWGFSVAPPQVSVVMEYCERGLLYL